MPIAVLAAAMLTAAILFLEYDIVAHLGERSAESMLLEIEELSALAAILIAALFVYAWRRTRETRRELERRLAAEVQARKALELALLDPLTGLANRRHFEDIFHAAAERQQGTRHALMLVDLDGFKLINDTLGHPVGDEVLRVVGTRLSAGVRPDDLVFRLGGDEFSVVAFNVGSPEQADKIALGLIEVAGLPIEFAGRTISVTASVGYTFFPEEGSPAACIYSRADAALYDAKARRPDRKPVCR